MTPRTTRITLVGIGLIFGVALTRFVPILQGQGPAPVVPAELTSFRDIVKKVNPAVVSIEAKNLGRKRVLPAGVPEEFRRFFEDGNTDLGFGSGVLIDPSGIVLTNNHVVEGADTIDVHLADGRKFPAKEVRKDPKTDLAIVILKTDEKLPFLELADSDTMEVGDRVLAVGAPFGLTGSVTHGIVSAKSRRNLKLNQFEDFLQTDAAINPGNSGGPLVNLEGKIVGINSAIKTKSGGFQGVGLAISSNLCREVSGQLLKHGIVKRGYLGIGFKVLTQEQLDKLGLKFGAIVALVDLNSPAAKSGMRIGDVVTSIGGKEIKDPYELPRLITRLPIGEKTEVQYVRDGKAVAQFLIVEELPENPGTTAGPLNLEPPKSIKINDYGLTVTDLTPTGAAQLRMPKGTTGVVVTSVDPGSFAAATGFLRGQVIVRVDKISVANATQFAEAVAAQDKGEGTIITLLLPNGEKDYLVLRKK